MDEELMGEMSFLFYEEGKEEVSHE